MSDPTQDAIDAKVDAAVGSTIEPTRVAMTALAGDVRDLVQSSAQQAYAEQLAAAAQREHAANDATAQLQTRYEALQAKYDALVASTQPQQPPPPPPPASKTLFGGNKPSQTSSGHTLQDQADVVAKWGKGAAMRQFFGDATTIVAPRHADLGLLHASWNLPLDDSVTALQTKVKALAANMKAGDMPESRHEGDSKTRRNPPVYSVSQIVSHKNNFHAAVKAVRPDLETINTCTAWLFNPASGLDPTPFLAIKADWLGVDFDGVKDTAYFDYTVLFARVLDLAKKAGYKGVRVPEFGWPQAPSDADDSKRAAEMTRHGKALIAAGFRSVCLFEAPTDGYPYRTTAKTTAAWKALVQQ
jgi:hypothetical protein